MTHKRVSGDRATFWQLFIFRATCLPSSNFLHSDQFLDRRFPRIVQVLFEGHTNVSEHFSNFNFPKVT